MVSHGSTFLKVEILSTCRDHVVFQATMEQISKDLYESLEAQKQNDPHLQQVHYVTSGRI